MYECVDGHTSTGRVIFASLRLKWRFPRICWSFFSHYLYYNAVICVYIYILCITSIMASWLHCILWIIMHYTPFCTCLTSPLTHQVVLNCYNRQRPNLCDGFSILPLHETRQTPCMSLYLTSSDLPSYNTTPLTFGTLDGFIMSLRAYKLQICPKAGPNRAKKSCSVSWRNWQPGHMSDTFCVNHMEAKSFSSIQL